MTDQDATLTEKIETINANLKPLYKQRYDNLLLMEALDVMLSILSDDESDKQSKEFQSKRKTEVEKEFARTQKLIAFFEAKLKPLQEELKSTPAQPNEAPSNGQVKENINA